MPRTGRYYKNFIEIAAETTAAIICHSKGFFKNNADNFLSYLKDYRADLPDSLMSLAWNLSKFLAGKLINDDVQKFIPIELRVFYWTYQ